MSDIPGMKEHHRMRFATNDGMAVMILESEYGNVHVREKAIMGDGRASWFLRHIAGTLDDAVTYCREHYLSALADAKENKDA